MSTEAQRAGPAEAIRAEDSKPELESPFFGMQPTVVSVDQEILRSSLSCVERGIEYAEEVFNSHESKYTNSSARHKREAILIEQDIQRMKAACVALRTCLGWDT